MHIPLASRLRRPLLIALALCGLGLVQAPAHAEGDFDAAEKKYRAYLKRPSFYKRTLGRQQLLATGDLRAFTIVAATYLKPERPQEAVRNSIVTMVTNHFAGQGDAVPLYAEWRAKCTTPADAWLWYRALRIETALTTAEAAGKAAADTNLDPFLRAAAIRSLGTVGATEGPTLALAALKDLPQVPLTRELLLEAAAEMLAEVGGSPLSPECAALADRVVAALDDKLLRRRSRYSIARALAHLLSTHVLGITAKAWERDLAAAKESATTATEGETAAPGRFFGLSASGVRTVYVIDTSDSMLTPLTGEELTRLKKRVTTGDDKPAPAASPDDEIPWKLVKNRFDLAREVLKVTLRAAEEAPKSKADATEERRFAVVLFGDRAKTLASTPTLVTLNASNVKAVASELDKMKPGTPKAGDTTPHPYGVLLGATNLHGGIRLAFRLGAKAEPVRAKGAPPAEAGTPEYVDPKGFEEGADTVFVLSDGSPTWDDWEANDTRDPEDHAGDPETGAKHKDTPTLIFQGPFSSEHRVPGNLLLADIERVNLFRRAEIHCVAIGEASDGLLRGIADIGRGKFRRAGGDVPKPAEPPKEPPK